jgi:hypothetical protein
LIFSDDVRTKQIPDILYDELNIKDKELLNKLKKYEIVHPEDATPIANEFPDFYSQVNNFAAAVEFGFCHQHFLVFLSYLYDCMAILVADRCNKPKLTSRKNMFLMLQGEAVERSISFLHNGKKLVLDLVPNRYYILFLLIAIY